MSKIKICFFADGESVHTQRWLREIAARGFDVVLITRRTQQNSEFKTYVIEPGCSRAGWLLGLLKIRRLIHKVSPDIVHGHYITSYGLWASFSGIKPLVLTAWGSDILVSPKKSRLVRWLTGWVLSKADLITADSSDTLNEIKNYSPLAELKQVQWGVDVTKFHSSPHAKERDVLNIVSLRNWTPNYNIDLILYAFGDLVKKLPSYHIHLHLLGGGELEVLLKKQAESLGITSQVTFHGMVNEERLLEILLNADISISIPTSDATAMSLLESMAAGLPVIVTDLEANRQWIDQSGGRIVAVRDKDSITHALVELAKDHGLRTQMGQRNRVVIEKAASRQDQMDKMARLYESLIIN